jgi:hypothetical protein
MKHPYLAISLFFLLALTACASTAAAEPAFSGVTLGPTAKPLGSSPTPPPTATLLASSTPLPGPTVMPSLTPFPTATKTPGPIPTRARIYSRGDLHVHTTCSDGKDDYEDMIKVALGYGYKFIAITDHHMCDDVIQACVNERRILCIPGMEVPSTGYIEVLALNITEPIKDSMNIYDTVKAIHAQGGMAIAAHPWAAGQRYSEEGLLESNIDAMECPIDGTDPFDFDTSALPCVWDSDAHEKWAIDPSRSTVCNLEIGSFQDVRNAILTRMCLKGVPMKDNEDH